MSKVQGLIFLGVVSCLCVTAVSADQLYKWVDDQGRTHYSQTPPPAAGSKAKAVDIKVTPPDPTAVQAAQQANDQQAKKDKDAQDEADEVAKEAAIREKMNADQAPQRQKDAQLQYCNGLRSRLNSYEHADDALSPRERGERKISDDQARQKAIDGIKAQIAQSC
jgi:hypothetical protein